MEIRHLNLDITDADYQELITKKGDKNWVQYLIQPHLGRGKQ